MASARATIIAQGFSNKVQAELYDRSLTDVIVNRDYQGEINEVGSKLNIYNIARISEKTYGGSALSADSLYENNAVLEIDQFKSFYWQEKTLDNWKSYIKDPHPKVVTQAASERNRNMDTFVLNSYTDVAAGNRVGTDADDGTTITITTGTGAFVVAGGTPVTSAWVGRGIKAVGHTKWYRVASVSSTTEGVIEDDEDDVASHYSGGTISGASYVVEAISAVQITTTTLLSKFAALKAKLGIAQRYNKSAVPMNDLWCIVPEEFDQLIVNASGIALHVESAYQDLIKRGYMGNLLGVKLFKSNDLQGDNTNGFRVLMGNSNWMTFAEKVLDARIEEDLPGDFGTAFKDLFVYGKKVTDSRRHFAAEGFWTFNV